MERRVIVGFVERALDPLHLLDEEVHQKVLVRRAKRVTRETALATVLKPQYRRRCDSRVLSAPPRIADIIGDAAEAEQVRLELLRLFRAPLAAEPELTQQAILLSVQRPGAIDRALRHVDNIHAPLRPPLHRTLLVARRVRPALLLDLIQAHIRSQSNRILRIPEIIIFTKRRVTNQRGHHHRYHSYFRLIHVFLHKMLPLHSISNTAN